MSGPLRADETVEAVESPTAPTVEVTPSRESQVGTMTVRRALPRRGRRTVGPWCFADHIGPADFRDRPMAGIGPHPHIGLQTVTWLVAGELLHRDSLGSEQLIRPGQLNLMTAGHGIAHAEEGTAHRGEMHGIQLWVAQPDRTRHDVPAFEHHGELPRADIDRATATVLVGELLDVSSPARCDTDHLAAELELGAGSTLLGLRPTWEHALVVLDGAVEATGVRVRPGHLCYLGAGRDELDLVATEPARVMLLAGAPFESRILMWWNFVARTHEEVDEAADAWASGAERFGNTGSTLERLEAPPRPWQMGDAAG